MTLVPARSWVGALPSVVQPPMFPVVRGWENVAMAYTKKYCVTCGRKLSRQDQTPEVTAFLNACRSIEGNTARYKELILEEDGVCFACGKRDDVTYYEL
jgi:hypothetical protein